LFIKEFLKLVRFEHGIMFAAAVFIGEIIAGKIPETPILVLSLLIPLFSEMGAFALNDYLDIEADKANKRKDRPLVAGIISPGFALWFSILSLLASTVMSWFISLPIFILVLFLNLLAVAYNMKLKDLPLAGNKYIAFTMGIPFIFGNLVVSDFLFAPNIILFFLGFVAGLGREIVKSVEDMHGDKLARGSNTLPILIGEKHSLITAVILYLVFIPMSYLPFFIGLNGSVIPYILITAANLLVVYSIWFITKKNYSKARKLTLIAFVLGLFGYLLSTSFFSLSL